MSAYVVSDGHIHYILSAMLPPYEQDDFRRRLQWIGDETNSGGSRIVRVLTFDTATKAGRILVE